MCHFSSCKDIFVSTSSISRFVSAAIGQTSLYHNPKSSIFESKNGKETGNSRNRPERPPILLLTRPRLLIEYLTMPFLRTGLAFFLLLAFVSSAWGDIYWASATSDKYHYPTCKFAKKIAPQKLLKFSTPAKAARIGYKPCPLCKPPGPAAPLATPQKKVQPARQKSKAAELYAKGKELAVEKKCAEALVLFDKGAKEDPRRKPPLLEMGVCKSELGRQNEAIKDFKRLITLEPRNAEAHYSLAVLYAGLHRYPEAIDEYRRAILLKPDHGLAYYNLGVAYATLERNEDAAEAFKEAVRLRPVLSSAYNNLGVAYTNLRNYPDAMEAFKEAVRLRPDDAFAYHNLGVVYGNMDRFPDAITCFKEVIRINPDDDSARYHLALAYARIGDTTASYEQYKLLRTQNEPLARQLREDLAKERQPAPARQDPPPDPAPREMPKVVPY